jgi:hypothetical protein
MKWTYACRLASLLSVLLYCSTILGCEEFMDRQARAKIRENSDFTIEQYETQTTIGVICDPECPPQIEIYQSLDGLLCSFKDVINEGYAPWHRYTILFTSQPANFFGRVDYNYRIITISMSKTCPPYETGLCPGIFEWEMGNVLMEWVFARQGRYWVSEREKLHYRQLNQLLYGCRAWDLKEADDDKQ